MYQSTTETPHQVIQIAACRFVVIRLAATLTGLTEVAIRKKIEKGVWAEGIHYRRAPDKRIYIDLEAYVKWVQGKR